jgi:hypothetical protein
VTEGQLKLIQLFVISHVVVSIINLRGWNFSDELGVKRIFAKGIFHLTFNFKKTRYRI